MVAGKTKKLNFTPTRLAALKLYDNDLAHNEQAMRIHGNTYEWLRKNGLVARSSFLLSRITDKGREALKEQQ